MSEITKEKSFPPTKLNIDIIYIVIFICGLIIGMITSIHYHEKNLKEAEILGGIVYKGKAFIFKENIVK